MAENSNPTNFTVARLGEDAFGGFDLWSLGSVCVEYLSASQPGLLRGPASSLTPLQSIFRRAARLTNLKPQSFPTSPTTIK